MNWHALATYDRRGEQRAALVLGHEQFDVAEAAAARGDERLPALAKGVWVALQEWDTAGPAIAQLARDIPRLVGSGDMRALTDAALSGPSLRPPFLPVRIFAAGSNYREHAAEMGTALAPRSETAPYVFMKADSSVIGPGAEVRMPKTSQKVDWEVELAVVIGRGGRHISEADALSHVAGYTIINDVSARDLTRRADYPFTFDWLRGKGFDTFGPLGPWLVPAACLPDPQNLRLTLAVNGVMMQDGTTASMIFSIAEQIAYLSSIATLRPGDVIATGTPAGVGMGRGTFLQAGDVMTATIEHIGVLENPVVDARD